MATAKSRPRKKHKTTVLKPPHLSRGSTVALAAPAFLFDPAQLEIGRARLEKTFGVTAVTSKTVHERQAYFAGSDERRLEELYESLTDPSTAAVLTIRGGYGCSRIYADLLSRLKKHRGLKPKIVLGYSDVTILLNGLYQDLGWITFHGPVVAGRAIREPLAAEAETFTRALFSKEPLGTITDPGMKTLVPGQAQGPIVGGCLSLLVGSLGTTYEIDTRGKILFIEEVDERPYRIDRMLTQLLHAGKFDGVRGVVFGQMALCEPYPIEKDPDQTTALGAIRLALGAYLKKRRIPTIYDFPAGHGKPQITFPIGVKVKLVADQTKPSVCFLEAGCR
jgi:muramoyltetrapeptide carboxypeptidase